MPTNTTLKYEPMPNDRIVMVNQFWTMRLKIPTIDLMYVGGDICSSDIGIIVPIAAGHGRIEESVVYEMDLIRDRNSGSMMIVRPRERVSKKGRTR